MDYCMHDMTSCATCGGTDTLIVSKGVSRREGSEAEKQVVLDELCEVLNIPRRKVGVGSSIHSEVFVHAAEYVGVKHSSMPATAEAVVAAAGLRWLDEYDSRSTSSSGGSTGTTLGLQAMVRALRTFSV